VVDGRGSARGGGIGLSARKQKQERANRAGDRDGQGRGVGASGVPAGETGSERAGGTGGSAPMSDAPWMFPIFTPLNMSPTVLVRVRRGWLRIREGHGTLRLALRANPKNVNEFTIYV
jgi:hypothetical protein